MPTSLLAEIVSPDSNTPVVVLFGGNLYRRDEVVRLLQQLGDITVFGTLSEAEGLAKVQALPRVDIVLIGRAYTREQRVRIRQAVRNEHPGLRISEPGVQYPYTNSAILCNVTEQLNLRHS